MMPSTGSPQQRVVKKLHMTAVSLLWRLFARFSMSGPFPGIIRWQLWPLPQFPSFRFSPLRTLCRRVRLSLRSFVGRFARMARTAEGGQAVFPPRTPGALARILRGAEAIRVSLEPLNAADQPGQITEVFNQCTILPGPALRG
jgi:hypothetical protein